MNVTIYKPTKSSMQSGRGKVSDWILEYDRDSSSDIEPIMGWTSSEYTLGNMCLNFSSQEDAISFARKKDLEYVVIEEIHRRIKPRNYSDNFKYIPRE